MVDGTSRLGLFRRILLPLPRPALTTVPILAFVTSWNFYLLPLLVFSENQQFTHRSAPRRKGSPDTARILALTALSAVPAVGFFLLFMARRIVGGLTGAAED